MGILYAVYEPLCMYQSDIRVACDPGNACRAKNMLKTSVSGHSNEQMSRVWQYTSLTTATKMS